MKKFWKSLATIGAMVALFGLLVWSFPAIAADNELKVVKFDNEYSIRVPLLAPSFTDEGWSAMPMGSQEFARGTIAMVYAQNSDASVEMAILCVILPGDKFHVVAFAVSYARNPGATDFYEDATYANTGVPSGVFIVGDPVLSADIARYMRWIQGVEI